jgi:hypothetical protein
LIYFWYIFFFFLQLTCERTRGNKTTFKSPKNQKTQRKPPTCRKWQTLSHNVVHLALIEKFANTFILMCYCESTVIHWHPF